MPNTIPSSQDGLSTLAVEPYEETPSENIFGPITTPSCNNQDSQPNTSESNSPNNGVTEPGITPDNTFSSTSTTSNVNKTAVPQEPNPALVNTASSINTTTDILNNPLESDTPNPPTCAGSDHYQMEFTLRQIEAQLATVTSLHETLTQIHFQQAERQARLDAREALQDAKDREIRANLASMNRYIINKLARMEELQSFFDGRKLYLARCEAGLLKRWDDVDKEMLEVQRQREKVLAEACSCPPECKCKGKGVKEKSEGGREGPSPYEINWKAELKESISMGSVWNY